MHMNYFEQIEAMHHQVREWVEQKEPEYKVLSIDGYATSEYRQTLESQGEIHPKYQEYILAEIQLRFKVHALSGRRRHLSCDVFVLSNGTLHMGDRLVNLS
jgi:hypothetical protein